jgi:hypothetical protein
VLPPWLAMLLDAPVPGAAGGLAWFLCGLRRGRITGVGPFFRKAAIEVIGGCLVASFLAFPVSSIPRAGIAFIMGMCWSEIAQALRAKATATVVGVLTQNAEAGET